MANLTETVYEVRGKTILYIPKVRAWWWWSPDMI